MAKTFKQYLKEISDQQMKDMSAGNAYNGGKSIPKQNKKAKAKDPKSQERKDAAVAKMNAEDKAARKAQADKFAAMKNEDLENNPDGNLDDYLKRFEVGDTVLPKDEEPGLTAPGKCIKVEGDKCLVQFADGSTEVFSHDELEPIDDNHLPNMKNEDDMERGMGALDKFRELHRKSIGSNDDEVVLKELIEVINDDALFADEFPALKAFTNPSEFDDSEIVTAQNVPGDSADEKIMSLIKAIGDDSWVDDFAQQLMKDFNMGENVELDRIKELAGASIDETYDDDDDFYEAYGEMWYNEDEIMDEAEYQGRKVKLGKPMQGDVKKFKVYVKDPKTGNVKKVNFGHGGSSVKGKAMSIKKSNPARRKSFRARHNCDNPGPRTKARYWSCRKW
jgi:hypothetical protein